MKKETVYTISKMISNLDLAVCFADYNVDDVDGETRHWSNKNFVEEKEGYFLTEEEAIKLLKHALTIGIAIYNQYPTDEERSPLLKKWIAHTLNSN